MSTTTTTETAPVEAPPEQDAPADVPDAPADPEQLEGASTDPDEVDGEQREVGPGAEAARYRRQLRAVEGERDALREQLTAVQHREVQRLAGDLLAVPGDLVDVGRLQLADVLGDDGQVDADLVLAATAALLDLRPGLGKVPPRVTPPSHGAGYRGHSAAPSPSWGGVLRPGA